MTVVASRVPASEADVPLDPTVREQLSRLRRPLLVILLVLAGVEVALAVMRDTIISADVALKQQLGSAAGAVHAEAGWVTRIPTFGQMILGFTLPFALAFVAIPLEYLIHSGRTVFGALLVLGIRGLGFTSRFLSSMTRQIGKGMEYLYDAVIFLPLIIERVVVNHGSQPAGKSGGVAAFSKRGATGEHIL